MIGQLPSPVFHRKYQRAEEGNPSPRDAPLETAFHLKDVLRGKNCSLTLWKASHFDIIQREGLTPLKPCIT
ncbi:hypothetical protein EPR50_G00062590 [Perca flavescens]|uniref:Uncharacterized protein n=1 Tax=Perca flavescens TaxID=8167 RepID=A0A484D8X5_PERFV|nr:hypothetical protein EPR50_G00062590 [Perca flavescens]